MDLDKKTLDFTTVEKQLNTDERSITSYVSKISVDRGGDIVEPDGLDDKNYRKNPIVLFNHNYDAPVGKNLWLKKEKDGVLAKTQFAKTLFADDIFQLVKEGVLSAYSIGFIPKIWEWNEDDETLSFKEWELLEYSIVSVPMNPDAVNESLKMVKSDIAKNILTKQIEEDKIKSQIDLIVKEHDQLKQRLEEIVTQITNPVSDISDGDKNKILELENEINKIKENISKQVESLDAESIKKNLNSFIVGELSRMKKNLHN